MRVFHWSYDALNRLVSEAYDGPGTADDYVDRYAMDLVGNRLLKERDTAAGTAPDASGVTFNADTKISYQYDDADRLLKESKDLGNDGTVDETSDYTYLRTQQTKKVVKDGTGTTVSEAAYGYDARGRMSSSTVTPYDANGTAQPATTSTYKYDPGGVRFRQDVIVGTGTAAVTKYLVDGANHTGYAQVLEEKDSLGVVTKTYALGHDVLSQQSPSQLSGETLTFLYDGHGSTRALIKGDKTVVERYAYDAYGNLLSGSNLQGSVANAYTSLLYSGEQTDRGTGLQYLRARYYDPSTGRFNRLDPISEGALDPHSPQSLHKYLYASANPVHYVDPSGNISLSEQGGVMGNFMTISRMTTSVLRLANRVKSVVDFIQTLREVTAFVLNPDFKRLVRSQMQESLNVMKGVNIEAAVDSLLQKSDALISYSLAAWGPYLTMHAAQIDRFVIYMPTLPFMPYREVKVSGSKSKYDVVLGFGAGREETANRNKRGRLTGVGIGLRGEKLSQQIWRMDFHPVHELRGTGDYAYIEDTPFHYHIHRAPRGG